jgi:hypothetical protein
VFPGAGAQVYYNEAGEPLGWDYPGEPDPGDAQDDADFYADFDADYDEDEED